jgi:aminoglycoside phosphotransferase (APT) family kinase protein
MEPLSALTGFLTQTRSWLARRLAPEEHGRLDARAAEALRIMEGRAGVVCHGDPWFGNMLVDEAGHLAALLDFEGLCVADPAYDLAAQTYLTPPSAERTIDAYVAHVGPMDDLAPRVQAYLLFRELWGLAYGLRNDLPDEAEHAFLDLRNLLA